MCVVPRTVWHSVSSLRNVNYKWLHTSKIGYKIVLFCVQSCNHWLESDDTKSESSQVKLVSDSSPSRVKQVSDSSPSRVKQGRNRVESESLKKGDSSRLESKSLTRVITTLVTSEEAAYSLGQKYSCTVGRYGRERHMVGIQGKWILRATVIALLGKML